MCALKLPKMANGAWWMDICCRDCGGELTERCVEAGHRMASRRQLEDQEKQQQSLLDSLPEDVLVDIFRRLPAMDVLRLRRVCRRWRDLLLHPDVWRRRVLSGLRSNILHAELVDGPETWDSKVQPDLTKFLQTKLDRRLELMLAVLRVAPCVDKLALSTRALRVLGVRRLAAHTQCAAARLDISFIGEQPVDKDILVAEQLLLNQEALGRLRDLDVHTAMEKDYSDSNYRGLASLMRTVHSVRGLHRLKVYNDDPASASAEPLASLPEPLVPSLRELCYNAREPDALLEMQLRWHAATLEVVKLGRMASPCTLPVALLDACPRLRKLQGPLLADVEPESFRGLETRTMTIFVESEAAASVPTAMAAVEVALARTAARLRHAGQHLTQLSMSCNLESGDLFPNLLNAVAESGSSALRVLKVKNKTAIDFSFWPALTAAIPRLPQLQRLDLEFLTPTDAQLSAMNCPPNLRTMEFYVKSCLHCWIHRGAVNSFFKRNSGVHCKVVESRSTPASRDCTNCEDWPCHERLWPRRPFGAPATCVVFYGHADDGDRDCCSLVPLAHYERRRRIPFVRV